MLLDLSPEVLLRAYASGIFPMGGDFEGIKWYSPDPRCIFELDKFHVPKRLMRTYNKRDFQIGINTAWEQVLRLCSRRDTDEGCWITDEIIAAYTELNRLGFAHSVEVYRNGQLAGGLYGVALRGAFMGESMFHIERDASKIALVYLVQRLKEKGYKLLDTQYSTSHLSTFGASLIPRDEYIKRLHEALMVDCSFV
jgi:leucyl/phenylalanyl-tRNA--protein transferase